MRDQEQIAVDVMLRFFSSEEVRSEIAAMGGGLVYVHDMAVAIKNSLVTNMQLAGITDQRIVDSNTSALTNIEEVTNAVLGGMRKYGLPIARVENISVPERKTN